MHYATQLHTYRKSNHFAHQAFCLDFLQNHIIYKREWQAITKSFLYYGWSKKRHNFLYDNLMWPTRVFGSLRNRAAGRLRTAEWRTNVAWYCALPFLCEIFSSFLSFKEGRANFALLSSAQLEEEKIKKLTQTEVLYRDFHHSEKPYHHTVKITIIFHVCLR